ncbi:unnamed protein product, partial [Polarella glacialis]
MGEKVANCKESKWGKVTWIPFFPLLSKGVSRKNRRSLPAMDPNTLIELLSAMDGETGVQIILEVLKARPGISPQVIKFACPALTYAPARGMQERRCRGVLKNFNQEKGYGFIASPEIEAIFGTDTFVHAKQ